MQVNKRNKKYTQRIPNAREQTFQSAVQWLQAWRERTAQRCGCCAATEFSGRMSIPSDSDWKHQVKASCSQHLPMLQTAAFTVVGLWGPCSHLWAGPPTVTQPHGPAAAGCPMDREECPMDGERTAFL